MTSPTWIVLDDKDNTLLCRRCGLTAAIETANPDVAIKFRRKHATCSIPGAPKPVAAPPAPAPPPPPSLPLPPPPPKTSAPNREADDEPVGAPISLSDHDIDIITDAVRIVRFLRQRHPSADAMELLEEAADAFTECDRDRVEAVQLDALQIVSAREQMATLLERHGGGPRCRSALLKDLVGAPIRLIWRFNIEKQNNVRVVLGTAQAVAPKAANEWPAAAGPRPHFTIRLCLPYWLLVDDIERERLVFHELFHCMYDDKGKRTINPHDVETFIAEAIYYGLSKREQAQLFMAQLCHADTAARLRTWGFDIPTHAVYALLPPEPTKLDRKVKAAGDDAPALFGARDRSGEDEFPTYGDGDGGDDE